MSSFRKFVVRACLLAAVVASSASAQVASNGPVSGLGTFKDLNSGRVWLKLDNFFGQTPFAMVAIANNAGFTLANFADVQALWTSLPNAGLNYAADKLIIGGAPNRDLFWGLFDTGLTTEQGWGFTSDGDVMWNFFTDGSDWNVVPNENSPFADLNLWAYQSATVVPEPGTVALVSIGLLAVGFVRRRARA